MEKYARLCSVTEQVMNEGWCFGDGQDYAATEEAALKLAKEYGFKSIDEAYEAGCCYYTEWEDESDYQYALVNNNIIELDY